MVEATGIDYKSGTCSDKKLLLTITDIVFNDDEN